jgi:hypothetical protein
MLDIHLIHAGFLNEVGQVDGFHRMTGLAEAHPMGYFINKFLRRSGTSQEEVENPDDIDELGGEIVGDAWVMGRIPSQAVVGKKRRKESRHDVIIEHKFY